MPTEDEIQEIIDSQEEICNRCEGNGRLWADGKAHLSTYKGETILCGYCGGTGKVTKEEGLAQALTKRIGKEAK